jgi:hypothetical protein
MPAILEKENEYFTLAIALIFFRTSPSVQQHVVISVSNRQGAKHYTDGDRQHTYDAESH